MVLHEMVAVRVLTQWVFPSLRSKVNGDRCIPIRSAKCSQLKRRRCRDLQNLMLAIIWQGWSGACWYWPEGLYSSLPRAGICKDLPGAWSWPRAKGYIHQRSWETRPVLFWKLIMKWYRQTTAYKRSSGYDSGFMKTGSRASRELRTPKCVGVPSVDSWWHWIPLMKKRRKTTTEKVVDKEERDLQIKRALEDFTD